MHLDVSIDAFPADWQSAPRERTCCFEIRSQHTGQHYHILLGLPAAPALLSGYPTLWALDGLATFPLMEPFRAQPTSENDNPTWRQLKPSFDGLIVAIGYASGQPFDVDARALDYTPATMASTGDFLSPQHGGADAFLRFITEELRPLLAQYFALNEQQQTLFGFSYGGLFTLYTLSTQPKHFQRYWAASPSLWFGENQTLNRLPQQLKHIDFEFDRAKFVVTVGLDEQYPASFASAEVAAKLAARTMVDNAELFAQRLSEYSDQTIFDVTFHGLPEHDHLDMLMHGARRVIEFAFAPS